MGFSEIRHVTALYPKCNCQPVSPKRSTLAMSAKIAVALANVQTAFTPSRKNLADPFSRALPGIYSRVPLCCTLLNIHSPLWDPFQPGDAAEKELE